MIVFVWVSFVAGIQATCNVKTIAECDDLCDDTLTDVVQAIIFDGPLAEFDCLLGLRNLKVSLIEWNLKIIETKFGNEIK
jgi:hypothetical protein